ncbi:MAG: hypothetical protein GXP26_13240 [Planctomycetes bacterium]|nr:hypothetical protein [Planctomycetota bacterium]
MEDNQAVLIKEDLFATLDVHAHPEVVRWQLWPILGHVLKGLPIGDVFVTKVPIVLCMFLVCKEIYEDRHPTLDSIRQDLAAGPDHIRNLLAEAVSPPRIFDIYDLHDSLGSNLKSLIDSKPQDFARSHIATEVALEKFAQREAG